MWSCILHHLGPERKPYLFGVLSTPILMTESKRSCLGSWKFSSFSPFLLFGHKWRTALAKYACWLLSCGMPRWTQAPPGRCFIPWHWRSASAIWPIGWCPFSHVRSLEETKNNKTHAPHHNSSFPKIQSRLKLICWNMFLSLVILLSWAKCLSSTNH